jgi:bacillithiol biosynthesis cysteine-adding enzyme BshC
VAVLTGQQVGLFSGPCFTVYKALTAIRYAAELSQHGVPAVPVFWLATEDHDFAEINQAWVFDGSTRPVSFSAQTVAREGSPVGGTPLGDVPLAALRTALADFPYGAETFAEVEQHYASGTFDSAFRGLLQRWFSRYGLLLADPLHPALRAVAAPLLAEAARATGQLMPAVHARSAELVKAGYHAQVHLEADTSLFFLLDSGERKPLKWREGAYAGRDRTYSTAELAARSASLSPNALLRPVVQDYIFPSVAVVGGPAELAYFAQSQVLYERLLGHMPVPVPRAGFTLLSSRAQKLLGRYRLRVEQCLVREDEHAGKIAAQLVPPAMTAAIASARSETSHQLDRIRRELTAFDPTLAATLDKSRAKILHQLGKLQNKTAREAMRRNDRAASDAAYLSHWLYPDRHLQERLYSILPFLAASGPELIDALYRNVRLECPDHQLLVV